MACAQQCSKMQHAWAAPSAGANTYSSATATAAHMRPAAAARGDSREHGANTLVRTDKLSARLRTAVVCGYSIDRLEPEGPADAVGAADVREDRLIAFGVDLAHAELHTQPHTRRSPQSHP